MLGLVSEESATVLSGDERLLDGQVRDFWRWALNDLRMNTARGYLAEYLVARAVGDPAPFRIEWDTHDVTAPDGTRIEVKACGRLQSWKSRRPTTVRWTIPKPNLTAWSHDAADWVSSDPARRVDVWVFALQTATDPEVYDPLDVNQWEFRVLPHHVVYDARQRSFAASTLDRLGAHVVDHRGLAAAVRVASSASATRARGSDAPDGSH